MSSLYVGAVIRALARLGACWCYVVRALVSSRPASRFASMLQTMLSPRRLDNPTGGANLEHLERTRCTRVFLSILKLCVCVGEAHARCFVGKDMAIERAVWVMGI